MKYFNMLDFSLSQIQIFLAVAEHESITRASETLNMTQSAVSKNIKYMEDTLGLYLFIRDRQTLKLTPAGRLLREESARIYSILENALEKAHVLQTGLQNPVLVGIPDSSHLEKIFLHTKKRLLENRISGNFHIECLPFKDLHTRLTNGSIDIVVTCGFDADTYESPDLITTAVPSGSYYAYMDRTNPLAGEMSVGMEDLKSSPFLVVSPMYTPAYEKLVLDLCEDAGFHPLISRYVVSPNAFICNFDTGREVFLADAYMRESENPVLARVPIRNTESSMIFVRRKVSENPCLPILYDKIIEYWNDTSRPLPREKGENPA